MWMSSKILAIGALFIFRLACAAPTNREIDAIASDNTDNDPIYVDLCNTSNLAGGCTYHWNVAPGICQVVNFETVASMNYNKDVTCTLYGGNACDLPGSLVIDHIVVPYDARTNLASIGWEKKANSFLCQWTNILKTRDTPVADALIEDLDTIFKVVSLAKSNLDPHNFEPMYIDLCDNLYLAEPCVHNLKLMPISCGMIDRMLMSLSSLRYDENITCTLFTGNVCDSPVDPSDSSLSSDHIVLPFDVLSDLTRVGWNNKANSISCQWNDKALNARSAFAVAKPVDNHHHDHDPMLIDICEDINFGGVCQRGVKLSQGDCGIFKNMSVSSIRFSDDLICLLYESSTCDSVPNVVLRGQATDLGTIGWNDRAHSIACLFKDDIFEEGSPLVTRSPSLLERHHRDNEVMHIQLHEDILFGGNVINWETKTGLCYKLDMSIFKLSSIQHDRGMVCTLFESLNCNKHDNLPALDLPITESNLGPFGWNDKANSFHCIWADDR
jgi:uncharacterized protein YceK